MNLLACFHAVGNLDLLSESEWISGSRSGHIDTSYLKTIINCFDESALELALRYADQAKERSLSCDLSTVTAGGTVCDRILKTLAALGYTRTERIQYDMENSFSSERTASLLANYVRQTGDFDLIITGIQSAVTCAGKTPYLLAEELGITCISQVTDFTPVDENSCRVTYQMDGFTCSELVTFPAVLAVGNVPNTYLRVPTLKQRMSSKKQPVLVLTAIEPDSPDSIDAESPEATVRLKSMEAYIKTRKGLILTGDAEETARQLYHLYCKEVLKS